MIRKNFVYLFLAILIVGLFSISEKVFAAQREDPNIISTTHPESDKWYSNDDASFLWKLPIDIQGVSYLLTDTPLANPGGRSDGILSELNFTDLPDGTHYLHVKFKQGDIWGPIAHYQFNIDNVPPRDFWAEVVSPADALYPEISFSTQDDLSGVDHYRIKQGSGDWQIVSVEEASRPIRLKFEKFGTSVVQVSAIDKAGNSTLTSLPVFFNPGAIASIAASWSTKIFNVIVDSVSNYGLLAILLVAFFGLVALLIETLTKGVKKTYHTVKNRPAKGTAEYEIRRALKCAEDDMRTALSQFQKISKQRKLEPKEKNLKTKIQTYTRSLKSVTG